MVVGGGKMGEALTAGLLNAGWAKPEEITIVEPVDKRRGEISEKYDGLRVVAEIEHADDVLLAVKPDYVRLVCQELSGFTPNRIISIAAGVRTNIIQGELPSGTRVIRVMPNTPAVIGIGMSALVAGKDATHEDLEWASSIFAAVGKVTVVDESLINVVTGLSGSGPAYIFALAEAMTSTGISEGLDPEVADLLTRQTILGAASLLDQSEQTPMELRAAVTSPNGTTAAAIRVFEDKGFAQIIAEAIRAATHRADELA